MRPQHDMYVYIHTSSTYRPMPTYHGQRCLFTALALYNICEAVSHVAPCSVAVNNSRGNHVSSGSWSSQPPPGMWPWCDGCGGVWGVTCCNCVYVIVGWVMHCGLKNMLLPLLPQPHLFTHKENVTYEPNQTMYYQSNQQENTVPMLCTGWVHFVTAVYAKIM